MWLINSEGEFSMAGLLQRVGDPSFCLGLQLQRSLASLHLQHHLKTPLNSSDRCLVKACQFIDSSGLPLLLHFLEFLKCGSSPITFLHFAGGRKAFCCLAFVREQRCHCTWVQLHHLFTEGSLVVASFLTCSFSLSEFPE